MEKLLTGDTLGRLSFSNEDLTTRLAVSVAQCGFWSGTIFSSLIKVIYFILLSFRNLLEPADGHIVKEPESSTSSIRHDMASLDLNCTCRMVQVYSYTT